MKNLILITLLFCSLTAIGQNTYSGKPIKFEPIAGVDITMAPVDPTIKDTLYGWYQMGFSIKPVYIGSKGGLYVMRTSAKTGNKYKYYIPLDKRDKITKE